MSILAWFRNCVGLFFFLSFPSFFSFISIRLGQAFFLQIRCALKSYCSVSFVLWSLALKEVLLENAKGPIRLRRGCSRSTVSGMKDGPPVTIPDWNQEQSPLTRDCRHKCSLEPPCSCLLDYMCSLCLVRTGGLGLFELIVKSLHYVNMLVFIWFYSQAILALLCCSCFLVCAKLSRSILKKSRGKGWIVLKPWLLCYLPQAEAW